MILFAWLFNAWKPFGGIPMLLWYCKSCILQPLYISWSIFSWCNPFMGVHLYWLHVFLVWIPFQTNRKAFRCLCIRFHNLSQFFSLGRLRHVSFISCVNICSQKKTYYYFSSFLCPLGSISQFLNHSLILLLSICICLLYTTTALLFLLNFYFWMLFLFCVHFLLTNGLDIVVPICIAHNSYDKHNCIFLENTKQFHTTQMW